MADCRESFYQIAAAIPRLTRDQEITLGRAARDGHQRSIERLVAANIRLAHRSAAYYAKNNRMVDIEDLISVGIVGLFDAARRYDPDTGNRFSTYADFWIKQKQRRYIEQTHSRVMRVPSQVAYAYFSGRMTGDDRAEYERVHFSAPSLDRTAPDGDQPLGSSIADHAQSTAELVEHDDTTRSILAALATPIVTERQRQIIMRYTGMHDGGTGETQQQIATTLGITAQRVSQEIAHATTAIRDHLQQ